MNLFGETTLGGEMASTSVYSHRAWSWIPTPDEGYAGKLLITLQKGKRLSSRLEQDEYAVEIVPTVGGIGHTFDLTNLTDPDAEEVYRTFVGPRPGEWSCTCKAGQYKAPTDKHADALRAAIEAGAFEGVEAKPVEPQEPCKGPWKPRA